MELCSEYIIEKRSKKKNQRDFINTIALESEISSGRKKKEKKYKKLNFQHPFHFLNEITNFLFDF